MSRSMRRMSSAADQAFPSRHSSRRSLSHSMSRISSDGPVAEVELRRCRSRRRASTSRFSASRSHVSKSASRGGVGLERSRSSSVLGERHQVLARVERCSPSSSTRILPSRICAAQRVDVLALLVHHVVVLEEVLADGEVLRLDLLLRALDRLGDHPVLDRDAFFHAEPSASGRRCDPIRRSASGRLRARGRSATRPGSPWRPARPRSWLSMRRAS